jgi:hypothetical protein
MIEIVAQHAPRLLINARLMSLWNFFSWNAPPARLARSACTCHGLSAAIAAAAPCRCLLALMLAHLSGCQVLVRVGVVMTLSGVDGTLVHFVSKLAAKLVWLAARSWFTRSPNTSSWRHTQHLDVECRVQQLMD